MSNSIRVDLSLRSPLSWDREKVLLHENIAQKRLCRIYADFGLFSSAVHPLMNPMQIRAFSVSISHFLANIYEPFREAISEIIIYQGDWIEEISQQQEKYAGLHAQWVLQYPAITQDTLVYFFLFILFEFLEVVRHRFPEECSILFLNKSRMPSHTASILLTILAKKHDIILETQQYSPVCSEPNLAICVSLHEIVTHAAALDRAIDALYQRDIAFHAIADSSIAEDICGIDYLLIVSDDIDITIRRQLLGFVASGGTIVFLCSPLGFVDELSFQEFLAR